MAAERTKEIKIRLTPEEHAVLERAKTSGQLAAWMRETCMAAANREGSRGKAPATPPPADPAILRQLAGIGGNLNQIARAVNTHGLPALDKVRLLAQLAALERAVTELKGVLLDSPV